MLNTNTAIEALGYVEASGQALQAAQDLATKVASDEQKRASFVNQGVQLLLDAKLITPAEKQAAAGELNTPEGQLRIFRNLVVMTGEAKQAAAQKTAAAGPGQSAPGVAAAPRSKQAGDASLSLQSGGNVGRRLGLGEKSAADHALIAGLGLQGRIGTAKS